MADDDDELRGMISELLRAEGHSTLEARDGDEVMTMLGASFGAGSDAPDLLFTDLNMPGLSGLAVLQAVRQAGWRLRVVVMTGERDHAVEALAAHLGAAFLRKPFGPDELLAALLRSAEISASAA